MEESLKKIDLQAYTLVGPTVTRPVQDPIAVVLLENQLYIQWGLEYRTFEYRIHSKTERFESR